VWTEVGPVYVHAGRCKGYTTRSRLPEQLATGPCVLRTYRADDTMNYEHNTVVTDEADLEPIIERLLSEPDVATVHVRTLAPQCFLYAVVAATERPVGCLNGVFWEYPVSARTVVDLHAAKPRPASRKRR
jgi:hypothetical protein